MSYQSLILKSKRKSDRRAMMLNDRRGIDEGVKSEKVII